MSSPRKIIGFLPSVILLATILFSFLDRGGIPFLSHAVFIVALFGIVFLLLFRKIKQPIEISETPFLFFAFMIFFFISLLISKTPSYGLTEFFSVAGGFLVFMFFAARFFLKEDFKIFHWGGLGLLILALIIGIYAFVFLPFDRFNGPFLNFSKLYEAYPNNMASFLLIYLPFLFYFFFSTRGKWKYFYGTLLIFSLSAFFLTSSRSAFLGFLGAVVFTSVFWIIFYRPKFDISRAMKNAGVLLIIIVMSAVLAAGLMFSRSQYQLLLNLRDRIDVESYEGGSGIKERLEFWQGSLEMAKENPWFGTGPGSFKFFFPRYQKTFGIIQDQPHNYFLALLVENGIFTALSFLFLLVFLCIQTLRWLRRNDDPLVWAAVFSVTSLVLAKTVDDNFNFVSVGIPFFGMLGFLASVSEKYSFWRFPFSVKKILISLFILSIPLVFLAVHEIYYNIPFKQGKTLIAEGKYEEGIEKLEQAEKLFWERDLPSYHFKINQSYYESPKGLNEKRHIRIRLEKLLNNICDESKRRYYCGYEPEIYFLIGKFTESEKQYESAAYFYSIALELDPLNTFKYYYVALNNRWRLRHSPDQDMSTRTVVANLLKNYSDLILKNAHLTIITENPEYADKLYSFLVRTEGDFRVRREFLQQQQAYQALWQEQKDQFFSRYHTL